MRLGLGFELREAFSGSFYRLDDPFRERAIRISLRLGVTGIRRFLRERRIGAEGTVFAEGLIGNQERVGEGIVDPGRVAGIVRVVLDPSARHTGDDSMDTTHLSDRPFDLGHRPVGGGGHGDLTPPRPPPRRGEGGVMTALPAETPPLRAGEGAGG